MNRFLNLCIFVCTVSLLSCAFVPVHSAQQAQIVNQTVLISQDPIELRFSRTEDTSVSFQFVGLALSCEQTIEIVGLVVYNDSDSTYVPTNLYSTSVQESDICVVQLFCFTIHGGKLRHFIDKNGLASIYLLTKDERVCRINLTEHGEQEIIRVLDNK